MKIRILKNVHLVDGEQEYDDEIVIHTDQHCCFSMGKKYYSFADYTFSWIIILQIGTMLSKDFREIELGYNDMVFFGEE